MKINNSINHISKFFKKIIAIFKEIKKLPNVWLYILLSIILTIIFFIFTFPYSTLIRNQIQIIGENIGSSANVGEIDFNLLTSTKIDNITITFKDGSELSLTNLNFDISIFSIIFSNTMRGEMNINNIKYEKDKTKITVAAKSGFDLKFNSMSELPASGSIKLKLQNVIANGITIKGFDIPPVRFSSIITDLNIQKKNISIDEFTATGPDIKCSISGSITVAQFFQQSQLNLNIAVDSSSPFIENYKILLSKWIDNTNKIQLAIRGSISNPRIAAQEERNYNTTPKPKTKSLEQRNIRRPVVDSLPKPRMEQNEESRRGEEALQQQPDQPPASFPDSEPPAHEDSANE